MVSASDLKARIENLDIADALSGRTAAQVMLWRILARRHVGELSTIVPELTHHALACLWRSVDGLCRLRGGPWDEDSWLRAYEEANRSFEQFIALAQGLRGRVAQAPDVATSGSARFSSIAQVLNDFGRRHSARAHWPMLLVFVYLACATILVPMDLLFNRPESAAALALAWITLAMGVIAMLCMARRAGEAMKRQEIMELSLIQGLSDGNPGIVSAIENMEKQKSWQ